MTLSAVAPPRSSRRSGRLRLVAALGLLALGGLVAAVATVAVWAHDTALDTDTYIDTTAPLVGETELSVAVADYLTDEVVEWLAVGQLQRLELPDELLAVGELVEPVEAALRPFVVQLVIDVLRSEEVAELRAALNREGPDLLVDILRGDDELVRIGGGTLILDLSSAFRSVEQRVGESVLDGVGAVPNDVAHFSVYAVPDVGDAGDAVETLDRLTFWLPIAAVVLLLAAVAVGPRRVRLLGWAGAALAVAAVVVLAIEAITQGLVLEQVTEPVADLAGQSLWDAAAGRLVGQLCLLVVAGGILAALGFGLDFARRNARGGGAPEPAK